MPARRRRALRAELPSTRSAAALMVDLFAWSDGTNGGPLGCLFGDGFDDPGEARAAWETWRPAVWRWWARALDQWAHDEPPAAAMRWDGLRLAPAPGARAVLEAWIAAHPTEAGELVEELEKYRRRIDRHERSRR